MHNENWYKRAFLPYLYKHIGKGKKSIVWGYLPANSGQKGIPDCIFFYGGSSYTIEFKMYENYKIYSQQIIVLRNMINAGVYTAIGFIADIDIDKRKFEKSNIANVINVSKIPYINKTFIYLQEFTKGWRPIVTTLTGGKYGI